MARVLRLPLLLYSGIFVFILISLQFSPENPFIFQNTEAFPIFVVSEPLRFKTLDYLCYNILGKPKLGVRLLFGNATPEDNFLGDQEVFNYDGLTENLENLRENEVKIKLRCLFNRSIDFVFENWNDKENVFVRRKVFDRMEEFGPPVNILEVNLDLPRDNESRRIRCLPSVCKRGDQIHGRTMTIKMQEKKLEIVTENGTFEKGNWSYLTIFAALILLFFMGSALLWIFQRTLKIITSRNQSRPRCHPIAVSYRGGRVLYISSVPSGER